MPSAVPSRNTLTSQPWRVSKQSRHSSTGQEAKIGHSGERVAAILHGKKIDGGGNEALGRSLHKPQAASPPSRLQATKSHSDAQTSARSHRLRDRPNAQAQGMQPGNGSRKRKATAPLNQRSARRQRNNVPELKDEAYIRRTMRMPTPQDYPNAAKNIFKNPKSCIINVARGARTAECSTEFVSLGNHVYQCTLYYNSAVHNQAVVGEGRSKASHSTS